MSVRFEEEFYCHECHKYMKTYLRTNMYGNYTIRCAKCSHDHFRVIKNGIVTEDRHDERMGTTTIIECLASTLRDVPWHTDEFFKRAQARVFPGGRNVH